VLTILSNAKVFAPESLGVRHVLVGGGEILQISDSPIRIDGAAVVECNGQALVPGLIDGQAHPTGGGGESGFRSRVPAPVLTSYTSAGVTTVVGVLGTDDTARDTRSLLAHTYALREEGLGAYCHTGGYHLQPTTLTGSVRDDIVFLDPVIGVGEIAISDHRSSQPTLAEILRVASDAHVAGLMTGKAGILHLHLGDGERGLSMIRDALKNSELPARVFNPTHVNRRKGLFTEAVSLAVDAGCYVDVTAFPVGPEEDAWPAAKAITLYLEAGGPKGKITVSSDGGGCLPVFDDNGVMLHMDIGDSAALLETLAELVNSGMALEDVLPFFTSNVADLLRLTYRGRIAPGCSADLVLLNEECRVESVMVAGRWHILDGTAVIRGQFETAQLEKN
jgi:beta-aspartyl-dipeptidase (metallo-type)